MKLSETYAPLFGSLASPILLRGRGRGWDEECIDEALWWPRVLWFDPGKVTGWCVVWFDPGVILDRSVPLQSGLLAWKAGFLAGPENVQARVMRQMVKVIGGPGLCVGAESFVIRQMNMSHEFLSPVRLNARLEFLLDDGVQEQDGEKRRRFLHFQTPADAKSTLTDGRLRALRMYTPGPEHARDATRHAVLHVRKMRVAGREVLENRHFMEVEDYV